MAEWSNELALQFLELYSAEPVLYDPKHPHHKNKKMIHNAWLRVQENFGVDMPVSEIKKKKDSLMASFRYQMRRRREAMTIGEPSIKTSWFAFDFMYGFLGQIYENETVEDLEPVLEFVGFDALDDSSPNDSPSTTQDNYPNVPEIKHEVIDPDDNIPSNAQVKSNQKEYKQKAASKRKPSPDGQRQASPDQVSQNYEEDDCDLYGKLIAKKLRKLPDAQRERLMYEIQGLFVKVSQYRPTS